MMEQNPAPHSPCEPNDSPQNGDYNVQSSDHFAGRIAIATVIVLSITGTAWLFVELNRFLMLIFAAVVLAAVFDALAGRIRRHIGLPRPWALAAAIIGIIALFAGAFVLFGSQIAREFETIRETLPRAVEGIQGFLDRYGLGEKVEEVAALGSDDIARLASQAGGYVMAASSGIADFVLVLVGAMFLAADPKTYRAGLLKLMPRKAESVANETFDETARGLRGWMMGQAVSSLLVAALTWLGLSLLGVPAAGGLGVIAGLLDIIPMVGPVIAGIPAVLLAFTVSPITALWTLLLFLGIQQLQGNFLQPMIQKQAVNVPPAVLLFSVLAAGLLFGFLGVLLAAPLTIVVFVFVQRVYVGAILGKPVEPLEQPE